MNMNIEVKKQDIEVTLPRDKLGIVMMQPFIELDLNTQPYKWSINNNQKQNQLVAINRTLEISKINTHGCNKTHFTIFPEYSIPGLEGIQAIDDIVNNASWENGKIIIGGIDGLNRTDYSTLCTMAYVELDDSNKSDELSQNDWVNCIVTWVKENDGSIRKFIQPKCFKSHQENHLPCTNMFEGKCVDLFKCKRGTIPFHFLSLICIDWIGEISAKKMFLHVLEQIEPAYPNNPIELDLFFIIQNNDQPNYIKFLENARDFFEQTNLYEGVNRDKTILAFMNTAGGSKPGFYGFYGGSSFVCSNNNPYYVGKCDKSLATSTHKLRGVDTLKRCKDYYLREAGSCIYSISMVIPKSLSGGVIDRDQHIHAKVHPIINTITDKRLPNDEVPASIKWMNDQLDSVCSSSCNEINKNPEFSKSIDTNHNDLISTIREFGHDRVIEFIEYAIHDMLLYNKKGVSSLNKSNFKNRIEIDGIYHHMIDHWGSEETDVLKNILYLLSILKICFTIDISNSLFHGSIDCRGQLYNILYLDHVEDTKILDELDLTDGKSKIIILVKTNHPLQNNILHSSDDSGKSKITNTNEDVKYILSDKVYEYYNSSTDIQTLKRQLLNLVNYEC